MKKKLFCLLLILILPVCFLFSGCKAKKTMSEAEKLTSYKVGDIELVKVEKGDGFMIFVDKKTKVMYLMSYSDYGQYSGLTIMLDANGKPLIYEGEFVND